MANKLSYSSARQIRQSGLSNQITERLLSGEGISSSFSQSISESLLAKVTGIKEKLDPLNIAKMMMGGSALGPALLGRMMGRSSQDIEHFAGTGKAKQKKDPLLLGMVKRTQDNIRVNDSFADALGKLYTLFKTIDDDEKLAAQLRKDFQQERIEEEQRRNEEVIRQIKKVALKAKKINEKARKQQEEKKDVEKKDKGPLETVTETATRIPSAVKGIVGAVGAGIAGYGLSKLLKKGEAATYNTVFGGKEVPLENMTVNEVLQYQSTVTTGSSAVGKYQIMRNTLLEAKKSLNLTGQEKFNKETQDMIYNQYLIGSKRPAVRDYVSGKSGDINSAALDLAREFASFPVVERTYRPKSANWPAAWIEPGESYYKGVGKNPAKASISVSQVLSGLQEERQIRTGQKTLDESAGKLVQTQQNNIVNNITQQTVSPTTSRVVTPAPEPPKMTNKVSVQTPKKEVGTYMSNISTENKEIKETLKQSVSLFSVGNNVNFTYQPGDKVVYSMEQDNSDLPAILR